MKKNKFVNKVEWGIDLASEHERCVLFVLLSVWSVPLCLHLVRCTGENAEHPINLCLLLTSILLSVLIPRKKQEKQEKVIISDSKKEEEESRKNKRRKIRKISAKKQICLL